MKKKGFTLIELLAVIVILAIIALIITPVVSNIILNARIAANARSVEGHVRNVELAIMTSAYKTDTGDLTNYDITDGELSSDLVLPNNDSVTCDSYTIRNGAVLEAKGCVAPVANWNRTYTYSNEGGASVSGEYQGNNPSSGGNSGSNTPEIDRTVGLFDENDNIIKAWSELEELGFDIEKNYGDNERTNADIINGLTTRGKLIIPRKVTKIGEHALDSATGLYTVIIPDTVTSIGQRAFAGCRGLETLVIPNSVTTIGEWNFVDCVSLRNITLPNGLKRIEEYTFAVCSSLQSIVIPDSVEYLGQSTFYKASSLSSITLPAELKEIGKTAFAECTSLTSISLPSKLEKIGESAFSYSKLTSIVFPESLRAIDNNAFWNVSTLTSATFEYPYGWFATRYSSGTSGTNLNLTNTSTNAYYLKQTYNYYYIKRNA